MKFKFIFIIFLFAIVYYSCRDIIEPNITNTQLHLLAPANGTVTTKQTNTFWWDSIKGATSYNFQIASPGFDTLNELVVDTNVTKNKYSYTLKPGRYQWRVRALNSSSANGFAMFGLRIDSTSDLSEQTVQWVKPAGSVVTNKKIVTLEWKRLYAATGYLLSASFGSTTEPPQELTGVTLNYTLARGDGEYTFHVKAVSKKNNTESVESAAAKITLDTKSPSVPQQVTPVNNTEVTGLPVELKWTASDPNYDGDSLYVASDSLGAKVIVMDYLRDKAYSFKDGSAGLTYYWRLKSFDKATNGSAYSKWAAFKIK